MAATSRGRSHGVFAEPYSLAVVRRLRDVSLTSLLSTLALCSALLVVSGIGARADGANSAGLCIVHVPACLSSTTTRAPLP